MEYSITTDLDKVSKSILVASAKVQKGLQRAVQVSTIKSHTFLRENMVSRAGTLRRSYIPKKKDAYTWEISSNLKYANSVESGSKAHVIKPKRGKFLLVPTMKSQMVKSGAQVRKFNVISFQMNRRTGNAFFETNIGRILLLRRVNHPGYKGNFIIKKKVVPFTDKQLKSEVNKILKVL